jgi:hypothetical protein
MHAHSDILSQVEYNFLTILRLNEAECQWPTPIILATWEAEIGRIQGLNSRPAQANSSRDPISKITRAKWTAGVAQMVEHLLWNCEALSSNIGPTKKQTKKTLIRVLTKEFFF